MTAADRFFSTFPYHLGPERPEEVALRPELDSLPVQRVKAGDPAALLAQGYKAGDCHRNCIRAAAENGEVEHVFGWTVSPTMYLSHSVLRMPDGALHCITPDHTDEIDADGFFDFIEDRQFTYDGQWMHRAGALCPASLSVVRRDFATVAQHYNDLLARIEAGELTYEEAVALRL